MDDKEKINFLSEQYLSNNVVTFFGAGASISSGLPIAWQIVRAILVNLCQHLPAYRSEVSAEIDNLCNKNKLPRFEMLISRLTTNCGIAAYGLLDVFENTSPNTSHIVVSNLLCNNYQDIHFTTNFDNLLEQAADGKLSSIYEPDDIDEATDPNIIHLHGGTSKQHQDFRKIVSTIDGILLPLPINFQNLLETALSNKIFVLVGYSGEDDDIRPLLERFTEQGRIWAINPRVSTESKVYKIVGSKERIIEDFSDNVLFKIYEGICDRDKSLDRIHVKQPQEITRSGDVETLLDNIIKKLDTSGCVSTILESLLDAGEYSLYYRISYHPHSGWFEVAPQRGAMSGEGPIGAA